MSPTRCPYCGKKISYFKAFFIRRRGEYFCKRCKKESNIHIKKTIWLFFIFILLMSLAIMVYYSFFTDRENLWFLVFALIPFAIFYLFSPLFVRLRPKMKFQDSLYNTDMVDSAMTDPDPTMQKSAKVVPTFVDDVILGDDDYKPAINSDIFNAIKEERKIGGDNDSSTKSFDKFENISSNKNLGDTMAVDNLKDIPKIEENKISEAAEIGTIGNTDETKAIGEITDSKELSAVTEPAESEEISDHEIDDILSKIDDV